VLKSCFSYFLVLSTNNPLYILHSIRYFCTLKLGGYLKYIRTQNCFIRLVRYRCLHIHFYKGIQYPFKPDKKNSTVMFIPYDVSVLFSRLFVFFWIILCYSKAFSENLNAQKIVNLKEVLTLLHHMGGRSYREKSTSFHEDWKIFLLAFREKKMRHYIVLCDKNERKDCTIETNRF